MVENRRILGTSPRLYKGIYFKSTLECSCYKKLEESGLCFSHESEKVVLWEGIRFPSVQLYSPHKLGLGKYGKDLELQTEKLRNITYTPDFVVIKEGHKIYFDVKGKENDIYPLKKKMFLKELQLREDGYRYMFMEPHTVRQMMQAINLIQEL